MVRGVAYAIGVLVLVALGAIAYVKFAPRSVPSGQQPLVTLSGSTLQQLRDDFNSHRGEVRIVALLSPT